MNNTIEMNGMLWVVGRECWRAEKWGIPPSTRGSTRARATRLVLAEVGMKNQILCRYAKYHEKVSQKLLTCES